MDYDESLYEKAYRILKNEIVTCHLLPGQRLSQAHLSRQMEIGITPVREALQRLALEGYVEAIPRHGYIVTQIDVAYLAEIFEMRQILEQAAVRLASERGEEQDLLAIREMSDFQYTFQDRNSYIKFLDKNIDFHLSIAELSGNQRLVDTISKLLEEMTRVFHLGLDLRDSGNEMRIEHIELAEALLARDSELAVRLMRRQIETSMERIVEALNNRLRAGKKSILQEYIQSSITPDLGQNF
jgi:DNA-binding GntR family transcriptional regulator